MRQTSFRHLGIRNLETTAVDKTLSRGGDIPEGVSMAHKVG